MPFTGFAHPEPDAGAGRKSKNCDRKRKPAISQKHDNTLLNTDNKIISQSPPKLALSRDPVNGDGE